IQVDGWLEYGRNQDESGKNWRGDANLRRFHRVGNVLDGKSGSHASPIIRYLDPLISLRNGHLPQGGGPWWSRLAGAGQTGLFFAALAPFGGRWRNQFLAITALPVSTGQCIALLVLLARKV